MIKKLMQYLFIVFSVGTLNISSVYASLINASSCSQEHIVAALNRALSGDKVAVPAGTCTWASGVTVPTGITVQGAGIGSTIINSEAFLKVFSLSDNSRVTGFEFSNGAAHGSYHQNWVVDYCSMNSPAGLSSITISSVDKPYPPTGVFHKCIIFNIRWIVFGRSTSQDWYDYLPLGSTDGVIYFEGCTLDSTGKYTNGIDSNYGGRKVIRFCNIYNQPIGSHGGRSKDSRGTRRFEAYRNIISNVTNAKSEPSYAIWTRGGDGVFFDNYATGTTGGVKFVIDFERGYDESKVLCAENTGYETVPHPSGGVPNYLCRDGIGAGRDLGLNPKPPSYIYGQESSPIYIWNNKSNNGIGHISLANGAEAYAIENRDLFIDESTSVAYGKGGISSGTWANRPACDASKLKHGFWATDMGDNWNSTNEWGGVDGALYVCDGVNWILHYKPAPYPHPLMKISSPQSLRIEQ